MALTNRQLKRWAERVLDDYGDEIAHMLGLPERNDIKFEIEPEIWVKDDKGNDVEAAAVTDSFGGVITLSMAWFKNHQEDLGAIVHEITHAVTRIDTAASPASKKFVEAIADGVRAKLGVGNSTWGGPNSEAQRFANLKPWQMRYVAQQFYDGTYSKGTLGRVEKGQITKAEATGKPSASSGNVIHSGTVNAATGQVTNVGATAGGGLGAGSTTMDGIDTNNDGTISPAEAKAAGLPGFGDGNGDDGDAAAAAAARKRQKRYNFVASAQATAAQFCITWNQDLQQMAVLGGNKGWTMTRFINELRGTQEYREAFPGIMNPDGTIKMSEATYLAEQENYENYASRFGINLGPKKMAWLFKNDVTSQEFADRAEAITKLKRNPALYKAWAKEMVQGGLAKPGDVDKAGMFKAILGEKPKAWYDVWQDTLTRNAAIQSGLSVRKNATDAYGSLRQKLIERISGMDLSEDEMQAKFDQLSTLLTSEKEGVLPLHEADLYGIKKKDVVKAVFGGKGSAKARNEIERAMDQHKAFGEDRANSQVYVDGGGRRVTQGVSDPQRQQQSEY